jgi:hypothetical protein
MSASSEKGLRLTFIIVIAMLIAAALILPLQIGIWLPDALFGTKRTLANQRLSSGHSFRVVQYWNRQDYYNTELIHTFPDGRVVTDVLDSDAHKTWHAGLAVDEGFHRATVTIRDYGTISVRW